MAATGEKRAIEDDVSDTGGREEAATGSGSGGAAVAGTPVRYRSPMGVASGSAQPYAIVSVVVILMIVLLIGARPVPGEQRTRKLGPDPLDEGDPDDDLPEEI